jgi:hypothetical protein
MLQPLKNFSVLSGAEWISFTGDAAPGGNVMFSFARGSEFG